MYKYLVLLRVNHYFKNLLIFLPLFFSLNLFNYNLWITNILGFVAFSLMASSIYIINDLKDVEKDRLHPTKKYRPIASGIVSVTAARAICASLFLLSLVLSMGKIESYQGSFLLLLYFGLNLAYSFGLKNKPIIDIVILAAGFVIRVLFGAAITSVAVSSWLYLTVMAAALFMGLGKRRNELNLQAKTGKTTRKVLRYYTYEFLNRNMYVCMALTNVFYALWAVEKHDQLILWTVPLVIVIMMKYSLIIEGGDSDGDPVSVLFHDITLLVLVCIYVAFIGMALYL